jgi:hypothetical protein
MAMSWRMRVEFELPLIGCVVSNPKYILAALRVTKEHRIAISALEEAPQVVGFGDPAGPNADRFNSRRAAWPGASANGLEFWGTKRQVLCSSALVFSAVEFHCPVRSRFLSRQS